MRCTRTLLSFLALSVAILAAPAASLAQAGGAIGTVVELTPPAEVKHAGAGSAEPLAKGASLNLGDALRTGPAGRIKISFDDRSVLIVAENSRVELTRHVYDPAAKRRDSLVKLYDGKVRAILGELFGATSEFRIESPTGVAGVKGSDFEEHYKKPCATVYSRLGEVEARNADPAVKGAVIVHDKEYTTICEGQPPTRPQEWGGDAEGQLVDARGKDTLHPPNFVDELGTETEQPNVQLPPDYPTDIVNQPTDTGGLPRGGPPAQPPPPKNP